MLVTDSTSGEASWPPQRRNTVSPSISPRKHITLTSLFVFGLLSCLVLWPVEGIKRASTPAGNKASRPSQSPPNPKTRPTDNEKSPSPHPPLRQAKRRDTCENHRYDIFLRSRRNLPVSTSCSQGTSMHSLRRRLTKPAPLPHTRPPACQPR